MLYDDFTVKPSYGAFADVLDELDHAEPPPPEPQPDPGATTPLTQAPATPLAPAVRAGTVGGGVDDARARRVRAGAARPGRRRQRLRSKRAPRKALLVAHGRSPRGPRPALQRRVRGRLRNAGCRSGLRA